MHDHSHHHHPLPNNERRLFWAILANGLLTIGQIIGGIVSGSLALLADALHNFSDAASLAIAWMAVKIGRKPADQFKTFGYKRAELIAALINLTTLILLGLYLISEAVQKFWEPSPVAGWIMISVAGLALVVDLYTVWLTHSGSKQSLNMRAAFLHNLMDALASIAVMIGGGLILAFEIYWIDPLLTLLIAGYVIYHGARETPRVIHVLMDGTPESVDIPNLISSLEADEAVENVHHVHVRFLDEHRKALEAHIVLSDHKTLDQVKKRLKQRLAEDFEIGHSTLEFELSHCQE